MNHLCGIRLSTVGMVVGWFNFIGAIFSTIIMIVVFTRLDDIIKVIEEQINEPGQDLNIRTAVIIALSVYLTTSLANVFASVMLILGIVKERHLLLTPWLINAYMFIFFNVLNFIYIIYVAIVNHNGSVVFAIVAAGISLVIQCVIWNAIYSLYKQIRANRDLQQHLLPTTTNSSYPNYTKMTPGTN